MVTPAVLAALAQVIPPDEPAKPAKPAQPEKSRFLSPLMGVRLAWALTTAFRKPKASEDNNTGSPAPGNEGVASSEKKGEPAQEHQNGEVQEGRKTGPVSADELLKSISAAAKDDPFEQQYIRESITAIYATMRNLSTIYSGRELNLRENDELRQTDLESIQQDITFGNNLKDYSKAIPSALGLGGVGVAGSILVEKFSIFGINLTLSPVNLLIVFITGGFVGIAAFWFISRMGVDGKRSSFIRHDYERSIYFEHYLNRSNTELKVLYGELVRIHNSNFSPPAGTGKKIDTPEIEEGKKIIDGMFDSLRPTICQHIDECINANSYDPRFWGRCETKTGSRYCAFPQKAEDCPYRKKPSLAGIFSGPRLITLVILVLAVLVIFAIFFAPGDVTLVKTPESKILKENQTVEVHVLLKNSGNTTISGISLEDTIPPGFVYAGGETTGSSTSLAPKEEVFLNYSIRSTTAGNFTFPPARALYTDSDGNDQMIESNSPSYSVLPSTGTGIYKLVSPTITGENQTLELRITFVNNDIESLSNLTITDTPPEGFTFIEGVNTTRITTSLKTGESRSIRYSVRSGSAGTFILSPASALFMNDSVSRFMNGSNPGFTRIESNSPEVRVIPGYTVPGAGAQCPSDQTAINYTRVNAALQVLADAWPANLTL